MLEPPGRKAFGPAHRLVEELHAAHGQENKCGVQEIPK
jgi:hypothetical protein